MTSQLMRAMVLPRSGGPLQTRHVSVPSPGPGEVLVQVRACGVCRTDLHIRDGELAHPKLPLIPGHEVVGVVAGLGPGANRLRVGERVGVPWLGWTDGVCRFCQTGNENLCAAAVFTGYTRDGGYAEYLVADERFCFPLPDQYDDVSAAPLLCAGLIGYRSFRLAGPRVQHLGLYGFGAAAHIIAQVAVQQGCEVSAFTRPGDLNAQAFARRLGVTWAGGSDESPPQPLDAAIIFAPVGTLVVAALRATAPGGVVVCGGIHMSDIPSFPYQLLWQERVLRSVANLTREDGEQFFAAIGRLSVVTQTQTFPLVEANGALDRLRSGQIEGAAVLTTVGA